MFEVTNEKSRSSLWKFLPIALLVFLILAGLAIFFTGSEKKETQELTGILRSGNPEFEWYSDYLKIKEPKIQMGLNFAGNRIVMITAVVENGGERTIDVVETKITFFNYEEPVTEEIRAPVKPGPYSPPIPPLTNRVINFYIEAIPQGWKSSHAEIELNGFRFIGTD
jgi:hypothetical protein